MFHTVKTSDGGVNLHFAYTALLALYLFFLWQIFVFQSTHCLSVQPQPERAISADAETAAALGHGSLALRKTRENNALTALGKETQQLRIELLRNPAVAAHIAGVILVEPKKGEARYVETDKTENADEAVESTVSEQTREQANGILGVERMDELKQEMTPNEAANLDDEQISLLTAQRNSLSTRLDEALKESRKRKRSK